MVNLDASASSDPDGDPLMFTWMFSGMPAGSSATLSSTSAPQSTFVADRAGTYQLDLYVSDGEAYSEADHVFIFAAAANAAPIANAGPDRQVETHTMVVLDGSSSRDPEGNPLTYAWTLVRKPAESGATFESATDALAAFMPDVAGSYEISLVVNDGMLDSAADTVEITALNHNTAPIANAGRDQAVGVGSLVTLDGRASTDPEGDSLTYQWAILVWPEGSAVSLTNASSDRPQFTPDVAGEYVIGLVVADGMLRGTADSVKITAYDVVGGTCAMNDVGPSAKDVGLLPDGRIVAVSTRPGRLGPAISTLRRFNSDTSAATAIATFTYGASALAVQDDGKIVVVGAGLYTTLFVLRFDSDGVADPTFVAPSLGAGAVLDVVVQPDGKIVILGGPGANATDVQMIRLLTNGTLDPSFGSGGFVTYDSGAIEHSAKLALQPDGKLVVLANVPGTPPYIELMRFLPDGTLDSRFGSNGLVTNIEGTDGLLGDSIAIDRMGSIVVAGARVIGGQEFVQLFRYTSGGSLDPSFGMFGGVLGGFGRAHDVAIQPDGVIVVVGESITPTDPITRAFAEKYAPSGELASWFANHGNYTFADGDGADVASDVALARDGSVVTSGSSASGLLLLKLFDVCQ